MCSRRAANAEGLRPQVTPTATGIKSSTLPAIGSAHEAVLRMVARRVGRTLSVDDGRDKPRCMEDRVDAP